MHAHGARCHVRLDPVYQYQKASNILTNASIIHSTAIICIVRTALSGEIKSPDVTWAGVPNAMARILEINLGIIAACAPIMKPLIRYMHARATGRDPREVLFRTNTPSATVSHSSWYKRLRFGSTSNKSLLRNPFHNPSLQQQQKPPPSEQQQDLTTQQSLGLPLEGPRVETYIEGGIVPGLLHEEKSKRSLQSQWGPMYDVQDRV